MVTPINFQICGRRTALAIDYKIWVIIQQRVQSTKVQDVKDLMQSLIDAWAGVEESVIQNVIDHRRRRYISVPAFSYRRIL